MNLSDQRLKRARAALQSFFIGDALSMPVHWFYNPLDIQRVFPGGIKKMEAAPSSHPSSIMSLHSTTAGGRGAQGKQKQTRAKHGTQEGIEIVGDVILKGKRQYWGIANQHYHQSLPAGENTLNAWCTRLLMRSITANSEYNQDQFLNDYIDFMTSDLPQHPDTYAESYHRGFFANLVAGNTPDNCGAITHDTPSIGGLVTVIPLAIHQLVQNQNLNTAQNTCKQHLFLTHPDESLARVCDSLVELIQDLLIRPDDEDPMPLLIKASKSIPKTRLEQLVKKAPSDLHVIGGLFSSACYISDSWPCMLYLAAKYQPDVSAALIANTNAGGENAHRGAVLGSVVGLINGTTAEELFDQLQHRESINREIDQLLSLS